MISFSVIPLSVLPNDFLASSVSLIISRHIRWFSRSVETFPKSVNHVHTHIHTHPLRREKREESFVTVSF